MNGTDFLGIKFLTLPGRAPNEISPEAILLECESISRKVNVEPSKSKAAEKYLRFSLIRKFKKKTTHHFGGIFFARSSENVKKRVIFDF